MGWLRRLAVPARPKPPRKAPFRPCVEPLEGRCVPSAGLNPAVIPAPNPYPPWLPLAAQMVSQPRRHPSPPVLFLGDSIMEFFADAGGARAWRQRLAPLGAEDLGVRASTTQNLLYMIDQGLLRDLRPRVVVLMIGVNNLRAGDTPSQTAAGVAACVAEIRQAQPQARILLLGLLPAGWTVSGRLHTGVARTNALLPGLADGSAVIYADVGTPFVSPDGSLVPGMMAPDGIHPTRRGYQSLADSLAAMLVTLENEPPLPAG